MPANIRLTLLRWNSEIFLNMNITLSTGTLQETLFYKNMKPGTLDPEL